MKTPFGANDNPNAYTPDAVAGGNGRENPDVIAQNTFALVDKVVKTTGAITDAYAGAAADKKLAVTVSNPTDVSTLATQATLAEVLAKLPASPALDATLLDANTARGTTADAVYASANGSAAGTIVSVLKGLFVKAYNLLAGVGAIADAVYTDLTGAATGSVIALLKGIFTLLDPNRGTPSFGQATVAGPAVNVTTLQANLALDGSAGALNYFNQILIRPPTGNRVKLEITNVGTVDVYICSIGTTATLGAPNTPGVLNTPAANVTNPGNSSGYAHCIKAGASMPIPYKQGVWATCATGTTTQLTYVETVA